MSTDRAVGFFVVRAAAALLLIGCEDRGSGSAPVVTATPPEASAAPVADAWRGTWNGPEGTLLRIEGGRGTYAITIQDLDGPRTFEGRAEGDRIAFDRNGVIESLRSTNGIETGMKWLSGKTDCLTVRTGEGYCRD